MLHSGAAAFHRGDAQTARGLLRQAVEHGVGTKKRSCCWSDSIVSKRRACRIPVFSGENRRESRTDPTVRGPDRSWLGWIAAGAVLGFAAAAVTIGLLGPR